MMHFPMLLCNKHYCFFIVGISFSPNLLALILETQIPFLHLIMEVKGMLATKTTGQICTSPETARAPVLWSLGRMREGGM